MLCDQIGRFIGLRATFQSLWQQSVCPNLPHSQAIFVNVSKSLIFPVKSFRGNFIQTYLATFYWSHWLCGKNIWYLFISGGPFCSVYLPFKCDSGNNGPGGCMSFSSTCCDGYICGPRYTCCKEASCTSPCKPAD